MSLRTYSYGARAPAEADLVERQLIAAHRYASRLTEIEIARREARRAAGDDEAAQKAADDASREAVRAARAHCDGLYWGTYLCVEDASARARRTGAEPRFHPWDGSGLVAVQLQGGLSAADLLATTDTRVRLSGEGRHRVLYLRVGSEGRAPVWATFPIVYHRDLPADATVKWVRCVRHRVGTHYKWSAQFVIELPQEVTLPPPTRGAIAIDVGWRRVEGGARAAVWVDDAGETGEILVPDALIERWAKVDDLRGIRDKNFNAALAALREWRGEAQGLPAWFVRASEHLHAWRSPARLASLAVRWRDERFPGDEAAFDALEAWRRQDKHLLEWEAHQRANVIRARREVYRVFARRAATYRRVIVEQLDLREMVERPEHAQDEDPRLRASRGRRFQAALSELLNALADAALRSGSEWIEAPSADTTRTCAACGSLERFDAGAEIEHTCSGCGRRWDQDVNAARNLLARAATWQPNETRSRQKRAGAPGESAAEKRRAKGLATRRARRSRDGGQDPDTTAES